VAVNPRLDTAERASKPRGLNRLNADEDRLPSG